MLHRLVAFPGLAVHAINPLYSSTYLLFLSRRFANPILHSTGVFVSTLLERANVDVLVSIEVFESQHFSRMSIHQKSENRERAAW